MTASEESGSALVMALLLVVVVGSLTASLADGVRRLSRSTVDARAALQALDAAEGGVDLARWRLARDPAYRGEVVAVGGAEVSVRVERVALGQEWRVAAVARCWPRGKRGAALQRRLEVVVTGPGLPAIETWRAP